MGYCASGDGRIYLNRNLAEVEKDRIGEIFDESFNEVYAEEDVIDLVKYYDKYHDDETMTTLKFFLDEFRNDVVGGSIEFIGEDNANWRFSLVTDENKKIKWVVQDGYIEWGDAKDI